MTNRSLAWITALTAAVAVSACSDAPTDDPKVDPPATPAKEASVQLPFDPSDTNATFSATLEIRAYQRPVAGATVELAGHTYTSDANGLVTIERVPVKDTPAGRVTMGGFMPRSLSLSYATAGSKTLRVFLFPEGTREKVSASAGGSVQHGPGRVTLSANSVVDAQGNAYTGDVAVSMRGSAINEFVSAGLDGKLKLADDAETDMLPGGFGLTETEDGSLVPTIPVASVQVELTDAAGNPLQLKDGATASLEFELESGDSYPDGAVVGTLVFDETRQVWTPHGTCTVQVQDEKKTCVGTVSHFSTYSIRWQQGNVIDGRTTDFLRCGRYVPVFVASDTRPAARLTQILSYIRIGGVNVPIEHVSNDGKLFITPTPDVAVDFRFKLQDAAGNDVGEELSYRIDQDGLLAKAIKAQSLRTFKKEHADSLKTTPASQFDWCPRLVVPIPLSAATPPVDPCKNKCDAATELCVEKDGSCIPKEGTCTPACGAHATCVAATACVCEAGYVVNADGTCVPCSTCAAGTYASSACTPARDTVCSTCTAVSGCGTVTCTNASDSVCGACAAGQYQDGATCAACASVAGCGETPTCTSGTSSQCASCEAGRYLVDGVEDACPACTALAGCKAGMLSCTSDFDSLCLECEPGHSLNVFSGECIPERCLANEHVVSHACVACTAGTTRAAGDDPAGADTTCTAGTATVVDLATASSGRDVTNIAGPGLVRGLEFGVDQTVTITSITVGGLPPQKASTAKLWRKSGAVDLQETDTYALGSPFLPTSHTDTTATFDLGGPLELEPGMYSLAVSVEDTANGFEWELREFDNSGHYLSAGSITLGPIWGWFGEIDHSTNTATTVQGYEMLTFQVPRFSLTFAP